MNTLEEIHWECTVCLQNSKNHVLMHNLRYMYCNKKKSLLTAPLEQELTKKIIIASFERDVGSLFNKYLGYA